MRIEMETANRSGIRAPRRRKLEEALAAAARFAREEFGYKRAPEQAVQAGSNGAGIEIAWVTDREMRGLNRRFGGCSGTTDVLAFEDGSPDPETGLVRLGEIACNLELASRLAESNRTTREAEAILYATHGLVHLLGGEDDTARGRRTMRAIEKKALAAAGLAVTGGEWD